MTSTNLKVIGYFLLLGICTNLEISYHGHAMGHSSRQVEPEDVSKVLQTLFFLSDTEMGKNRCCQIYRFVIREGEIDVTVQVLHVASHSLAPLQSLRTKDWCWLSSLLVNKK